MRGEFEREKSAIQGEIRDLREKLSSKPSTSRLSPPINRRSPSPIRFHSPMRSHSPLEESFPRSQSPIRMISPGRNLSPIRSFSPMRTNRNPSPLGDLYPTSPPIRSHPPTERRYPPLESPPIRLDSPPIRLNSPPIRLSSPPPGASNSLDLAYQRSKDIDSRLEPTNPLAAIYERLDDRDKELLNQYESKDQYEAHKNKSPEVSITSDHQCTSDNNHLPYANYLLVIWDAHFKLGHLLQLGAFINFSKKGFIKHSKPVENMASLGLVHENRLKYNKDYSQVVHPVTDNIFYLMSLKECLESFLDFLQKNLTSQRPAFDGIVLLSQSEEDIPFFIRAVRKSQLETKFNALVKGMGDLKSFVSDNSPKHMYYVNELKTNLGKDNWSDRVTRDMSTLIERIVGETPNYANFFEKCVQPMNSAKIRKLASYRSRNEQHLQFASLQQYLEKQLINRQYPVVQTGLFAIDILEGSNNNVYKKASEVFIMFLSGVDVTFETLHRQFNDFDLAKVEQTIKSRCFSRLSGFGSAEVDQVIVLIYLITILQTCICSSYSASIRFVMMLGLSPKR